MADIMKEDDENPDEILIVEDESQLNQEAEEHDEEEEDDERISAQSEEDEEEEDGERKAIRERRRQERQERKERKERAKLELEFLRKRNDDLERRLSAQEQRAFKGDLNAFDNEIAKATREAEMAERVIAKAVAAGNGDDVAQAMRYRDQAFQRAQQLQYQKQLAAQQAPVQSTMDDMTMHYAREFIEENPWYDAQGRDEDSAIVIAIDQALAKDGYNPQTEEYWDELRRRASRRLPERFNTAPQQRQQPRRKEESEPRREPRGGPAVGSGREHAPPSTRKEIYISPERKQALIEAGVWDDPVLRNKYVKRYAEYDRQNRS